MTHKKAPALSVQGRGLISKLRGSDNSIKHKLIHAGNESNDLKIRFDRTGVLISMRTANGRRGLFLDNDQAEQLRLALVLKMGGLNVLV